MIMIKVINLSEQPRWRTSILNINQALSYFPSTSRDNDDDDDDDDQSDKYLVAHNQTQTQTTKVCQGEQAADVQVTTLSSACLSIEQSQTSRLY